MTAAEFPAVLLTPTEWQKRFTAKRYEEAFQEYNKSLREHLLPCCAAFDDGTADGLMGARLLGDALGQRAVDWLNSQPRRRAAAAELEMSGFLVGYLLPALGRLDAPSGDALCDGVLDAWSRAYPKRKLGKATYEQIAAGFRKPILGLFKM